jgi:hypothetical protein
LLVLAFICIPGGLLTGGVGGGLARRRRTSFTLGVLGALLALFPDLLVVCRVLDQKNCETSNNEGVIHSREIVPLPMPEKFKIRHQEPWNLADYCIELKVHAVPGAFSTRATFHHARGNIRVRS